MSVEPWALFFPEMERGKEKECCYRRWRLLLPLPLNRCEFTLVCVCVGVVGGGGSSIGGVSALLFVKAFDG